MSMSEYQERVRVSEEIRYTNSQKKRNRAESYLFISQFGNAWVTLTDLENAA